MAARTQNKKSNLNASTLTEFGKIPPQATDIEEVILGAILLEKDAINIVYSWFSPDVFYKDEHKEIYRVMMKLYEKRQPIDIITVSNLARTAGVLEFIGGAFFISDLTNRVASAANIEYHASIVYEKYLLRRMIETGSTMQKKAYDESTDDAFQLLDEAAESIMSIGQIKGRRNVKTISQLVNKALEETAQKMGSGESDALMTGYIDIDRKLKGMIPGDLIILAARPGMGKTSLAVGIVKRVAILYKKGVLAVTLEMTESQLTLRMLSEEAMIRSDDLMHGKISDDEYRRLYDSSRELADAPIFIDDTPAINIYELASIARKLKKDNDIKLIVIDYLQLMSGIKSDSKFTNREQEISGICRGLKSLAKELKIPIIALSQLTRMVESRGGQKRPQLIDLRESGSIEQDADRVLFIHRPEYYEIFTDAEGKSTRGLAEIIFAKNRHGAVGSCELRFIAKYSSFTDWNPGHPNGLFESQDDVKQISKAPAEEVPYEIVIDEDVPF